MRFGTLWLALLVWGCAAHGAGGPPALLEKAESVQRLGHRNQALEYLEQARLRAQNGDDRELAAAIDGALGKAYLLRGRTDEARAFLTQALAQARRLNARTLEAAVLNDLGNLASTEGKADEALARYRESIELSRALSAYGPAARAAAN